MNENFTVNTYHCEDGCCRIDTVDFTPDPNRVYDNIQKNKAGVFIYDPQTERVLLVQSCGRFWGLPKGTLSPDEDVILGAIREVSEETGLLVNPDDFSKKFSIPKDNDTSATYYYTEMSCDTPVKFPPEKLDNSGLTNDANGITWIRVPCLLEELGKRNMSLNYHTKLLFQEFLGVNVMKERFQKIGYRGKILK